MIPMEDPVISELVALLQAYGVRDLVLCPGSRNAPLVHALSHQLAGATCHSIIDERSAGFYALGLALATHRAVVVCCTSGTAVANLHPAVAEAYYQGVPLIVLSADRPERWIGQWAGQTLPQPELFGSLVRKAVHLPEPHTEEERWYCNRLINEALLAALAPLPGPVQINVPISDPGVSLLPPTLAEHTPGSSDRRPIGMQPGRCIQQLYPCRIDAQAVESLLQRLVTFERKMILVGQESWSAATSTRKTFPQSLREQFLCIGESLSNSPVSICSLDALLASLSEADRRALQPDLLITLGGHIVSNKMKQYLRTYPPRETWHLSPDPTVVDLFCSLTEQIIAPVGPFLETLAQSLAGLASSPYAGHWRERIDRLPSPTPRYSSLAVVGSLLSHLPEEPCVLHLANSSSVRYAELFRKPRRLLTLCNRGTSGIEGSLSTALGFARQRAEERHFIVIGDLSFFYDLNALGLPEVGSNVRVLLLNNQRGSIFQSLPTLEMDRLSQRYITAEHQLQAQGWAESCGWEYLSVHEASELEETITYFVGPAERPRLLEAFVSSEDEIAELQTYFKQLQPREEL
ncbi:2-succinyl-5-enolpyruvyl-6-hydroxy-3-cyclohexene-1-carboxylic-acid synthase [Porphyromonas asaccharolytica PR426713P-I]|uniref:2-succinyl-5-enolpyruvyl-6-hydroxy-3- cyclohexene-1-carboxylic-acid synthase n=1 Tax=Porphyromonas asaccharolytica TaxID=28123 RepID=UPI0001EB16A1|nr:2-succinyl-5-enolpyruvyl-6-hydroxy-3-cyclohexene-1-carboxylic-acid synthase [Porphyromonas asaccharolytica]EFR35387.1 2-succinyl-5-enolpyruvyl-6-hydroxy-3-cyclohexene-1-carboxylic-acid synthase [Porphyromonas asaccharolytica PR426713P-I]